MKQLFVALALLGFALPVPAIGSGGTYEPPPDSHYYPHVSGPPAGSFEGTLVNYGQGSGSGNVSVLTKDGKRVSFYVARGIEIDGQSVRCGISPRPPSYRRDPRMCEAWLSYVHVGRTVVRVDYWKGTRYGRPTLITRKLTVMR